MKIKLSELRKFLNESFQSLLSEVDESLTSDLTVEVSPPSDKAEEFIAKNKEDFKKRYGARWKEALYSTAWKKFNKK